MGGGESERFRQSQARGNDPDYYSDADISEIRRNN